MKMMMGVFERYAMLPGPVSIRLAMLVWLTLASVARPDDPPKEPEEKPPAVPAPSPEQLAQITKTARRIVPSVFRVGRPGSGATAFLISRKHRLLATAGHVADFFHDEGPMFAIPDGTATTYRIDRAYFHPGTVRWLDLGFSARSDDPEDGPVDHLHGPDVAVLHLAEGGPDLPDELNLATAEETQGLDGRSLGMFGYPGELQNGWPTTSRPAWAILAAGICLSKVDDEPSGMLFPRPQRFWVSTSLNQGASGGLVFLDNGHVSGIIAGGQLNKDGTWSTQCTRSDTLIELLQYHRLAGLEPDPRTAELARSVWKNDPRLPQFRKAVLKIADADEWRREGRYQSAGRLCNEVIEEFPAYTFAVLQRSRVYSDYCDAEWDRLSPLERTRIAHWADEDAKRWIEADVENHQLNYLVDAQNKLLLGRVYTFGKRGFLESVTTNIGGIIGTLDGSEEAWGRHLLARASYDLGQPAQAEVNFAEAIRLEPEEPRWRLGRAKFYEELGRTDLAAEDRRKAVELKVPKLPVGGRSPFDLDPSGR